MIGRKPRRREPRACAQGERPSWAHDTRAQHRRFLDLPSSAAMATASDIEEGRSQRRTAIFSIFTAAVLVGLKLGVGAATGSLALISTGVESSSTKSSW